MAGTFKKNSNKSVYGEALELPEGGLVSLLRNHSNSYRKWQSHSFPQIRTKYALLNPSNYVLELTKPFNPLHQQTLIP